MNTAPTHRRHFERLWTTKAIIAGLPELGLNMMLPPWGQG